MPESAPITETAKPKPAAPTVGRVIYVRSNRWTGIMAALVVSVLAPVEPSPDAPTVVWANVMVDAVNHPDLLSWFRSRPEGNTVKLEYGVQNPGDTGPAPDGRDWFMGEWMPFQVGQVPASLAVQGQLTALQEKVAAMTALPASAPSSVTAALLHLAGVLEGQLPANTTASPRHNLLDAVSALLDGRELSPIPAAS